MCLHMASVTRFSPWYLPRVPPEWFSPLDKFISLYFCRFIYLFIFMSQGTYLLGFHQVMILFFVFLIFFFVFLILGYFEKLCETCKGACY